MMTTLYTLPSFLILSIVTCATCLILDSNPSLTNNNERAKWASQGQTVAGGNGPGSALNQLNSSYGVIVDSNGDIFISDYFNNRIMKWKNNTSNGTVYVGGRCGITDNDHLCYPSALTSTKNGTLFVTVQNDTNGAVIRVKQGSTVGDLFIVTNTSLYGIVWDNKEEFLYLGHHRDHRVVKYNKNGEYISIVAGGNGRGSASNQLDYPRGVAVDENGTVYVADSNNHRIVKWLANATEGIVVFGGNGSGNRTDQIDMPAGIIRDRTGTIYVVDERNHRVMSIREDMRDGIVIGDGKGQLDSPIYLALNNEGDLYVSDWNNFRIQMFTKERNSPSSGVSYYVQTSSNKLFAFLSFLPLMVLRKAFA